jgi:hypothetical protein
MPDAYRQSQRETIRQLKEQWTIAPLDGPVCLRLNVRGEGRGDADNIAGAFMDAAVGIVFSDDRVKVIPHLELIWEKAPKKQSSWTADIWILGKDYAS